MHTRFIRSLGLVILLLAGFVLHARADDTPTAEDTALSKKLMTAIANHDYDAFVADGTPLFKARLTKPMFDNVADNLGPMLKDGYALTFLNSEDQRGYRVTRWKIALKDSNSEIVATLSVKDGKVGGFYIK